MTKPKKKIHFIKKPIYIGGLTAMRQLIKENMKYPKLAIEQKIEGSVYLRYDIDYKGSVSEVKILQGLTHGCNEEAERIVRLFKFKVPKIPRRHKVAFHKTIRIHFKLPKTQTVSPKPKQESSPYRYAIVPNKPATEAPSKQKGSYTYTINL